MFIFMLKLFFRICSIALVECDGLVEFMKKKTISHPLLDNPKFQEFIDAFNAIPRASEKLSIEEGRQLSAQFFLSREIVYEPVFRIEDKEILGRNQTKIPLRIYTPDDSKTHPILVYFHRGGWVFGGIDEADPVCRKLANHFGCLVVSVGYRLAPENPFPAPLHDCYDATEWVSKNLSTLGAKDQKVIVCGESAGGNLAAAVALMARDKRQPFLSAQLLIYPVISSRIDEAVYDDCVDQYFLTKDAMTFYWNMYLQKAEDQNSPYASLDLGADFTGLPPTVIITAGYDPLQDEAVEYGRHLKAAGVKVFAKSFPEVIHGFIDLPVYDEKAKIAWIDEIGELLRKAVKE